MIEADLIIHSAGAVVTCAGDPSAGPEAALGILKGGAIAARAGWIVWVGPQESLSREVLPLPSAVTIDAAGGLVAPGYVDAHTHLVFAGDRAREFSLRCGGASYQELLAAGGGILATVRATRAASEDELVELALPRVRRLVSEGVTTVEVKSGYGLTIEDELKILRAVRRLGQESPVEVVGTLLPLHALPPDAGDRDAWVARMIDELLPVVAGEGLARFADVFVEQGAFTHEEARMLAAAAKAHGLGVRLHVDQLTAGRGAELAAELGAVTADHLETITPEGVEALAKAGVAATLLPISTLYLKCPSYAPGRVLADAGVRLALGSNCNPGSAMTESFSLALSLACLGNGLTASEAFLAATAGGAAALGLGDRGRLEVGLRADLVLHGAPSVEHLAYHLAARHARAVIIGGELVHEDRELPPLCA
ncbi:imidazolonepropionase [Vulgatibacter incomptus]|uniref:Imidazolonepropionase n=1 Tax=Vulgatibacter incomptus TaxID=1391653 RepID=A0A0K1PDM9_9BACT|nr:imidazolonepropionase [Vulgatibacter incomptus]AKU91612.1 Imidazolonepropionase [Vulgatibacter incomptus]